MSESFKKSKTSAGSKKFLKGFPSFARSGSGVTAKVGKKRFILGTLSSKSLAGLGAIKQIKRVK